MTRSELLKRLKTLECERHKDYHRDLHELIVDFLLENFVIEEIDNDLER